MTDAYSSINLLQGTDSTWEFSTGNTLPLVARPWGMHHWSLQTADAPWLFNRRHRRLRGIRLTHQPSPWMQDYCSLTLQPFNGAVPDAPSGLASAYRVEEAKLEPGYLAVEQVRTGIRVELVPTNRGGLLVVDFRGRGTPRLAFVFDGEHSFNSAADGAVGGISRNRVSEIPENFALHYAADFDVKPERVVKTEWGGYAEFSHGTTRVKVRLGGSFISAEMAGLAIEREVADKTLPQLKAEAEKEWRDCLSRVRIEAHDEAQHRTFYSCLYRCLLFPRFLGEVDRDGGLVHRSPYDGAVHGGEMCADSGFWDGYRTLYPLLTLVYPDIMTRMLRGWTNACRQSGWTPKWPSPGLRACMIGSHFNVVAADALVKGLTDWDIEEVYAYLWKDATVPPEDPGCGREGLADYLELGYVPAGRFAYAASCTLDYAYDDFAVAQVARHLGRVDEAELLLARSRNYRHVYDREVGFMRGKRADGGWGEPFNAYVWGGPFIEGGPWQHRFNVPHDPEGLAELMGGPERLCQALDEMLACEPRSEPGTYGEEIHEATEMALAGFGQYAHSNQPVHAYLFLYGLMGQPEKTRNWVGRICQELYTPDSFPGDEDNGEMAAWYLWASLGLFPHCPGKPEYTCHQPLLRDWELRVPAADGELTLQAKALARLVARDGARVQHGQLLADAAEPNAVAADAAAGAVLDD